MSTLTSSSEKFLLSTTLFLLDPLEISISSADADSFLARGSPYQHFHGFVNIAHVVGLGTSRNVRGYSSQPVSSTEKFGDKIYSLFKQ